MNNLASIIKAFPVNLQNLLNQQLSDTNIYNTLEEIRIRVSKPVILKAGQTEKVISYYINPEEILNILQYICDNSIYSYQNQICNGYITLPGGHRVGITGSIVMKENKIININYISSLNFRISRQVIGCSTKILKYVLDATNNTVYNTLMISKPGAGKTTLLRDLVRKVSNGMDQIQFKGLTVGLVDERGELAACYKGIPQNDIGIRTDVLDNVPKAMGMKMLIRSMSPSVIVADEIGSKEDCDAIEYAICSGIKGIFTAHGNSLEDLKLNLELKKLIEDNLFERLIFLNDKSMKGEIDKVYGIDKINHEYILI